MMIIVNNDSSLPTEDSLFTQLAQPHLEQSQQWNSHFDSSGFVEVSIARPQDVENTDWEKILRQTKKMRKIRAKDELSPEL